MDIVGGGGLNRAERQAAHWPPSSVEVKESGAIPTLPLRLHDTGLDCKIKYSDKFIF
jgi:hypothetical protein